MVLDTNTENEIPFSMKVPAFNYSEEARLLAETPLSELSSETCIKLSEMLNGRKILRHAGHDRDWRGIAELAKVRNFCNNNSDDPMQTVLSQWTQRNVAEATCFYLLHFLSQIDRWDVSDDIFTFLLKDARQFEYTRSHANVTGGTHTESVSINSIESSEKILVSNNINRVNNTESEEESDDADNEENDDGGSSSSASEPPSPPPSPPPSLPTNLESLIARVEELTNAATQARVSAPTTALLVPEIMPVAVQTPKTVIEQYESEKYTNEVNPLTRQDAARLRRGLPLTKYDAFVLYAEPDQHYANEMQQKLEKYTEYNFQLVFKNRDLLGGTFFHDAVTELMEDRCNYVLLIVTPNFNRDYESCFFFHNAQTLQLQENRRKIIPLLYGLQLPRRLRGLHTLKYHSEHFWDLLVDSLSVKELPPLTKTTEYNHDMPALTSMPKPPDAPIAPADEYKSEAKPKTQSAADNRAGKKKFLKKPEWIKKKKVQQ
uniref:Myeloid differentiation primary response protein MyD88 n=1 Tax=Bactrocera latifrons TaxID=174628 RepID=A0A0K8VAP5_BACLA